MSLSRETKDGKENLSFTPLLEEVKKTVKILRTLLLFPRLFTLYPFTTILPIVLRLDYFYKTMSNSLN